MRNSGFIWLVALIMTALDFYVFQVVKMLAQSTSQRTKTVIFTTYWTSFHRDHPAFYFSSHF